MALLLSCQEIYILPKILRYYTVAQRIRGVLWNAGKNLNTTAQTKEREEQEDKRLEKKLKFRIPKRQFLDAIRIYVKGGSGGMGGSSYGGTGGVGGNVIVKATTKLAFPSPPFRFEGLKGENSLKGRFQQGRPGKDYVLEVPTGTLVLNEDNETMADLNDRSATFLAAKGGEGGSELTGFNAKRGQMRHLRLEIKTVADVGLVGFPNAGKSTLLAAVSKAAPKIANYPFTTLRPQLGVIQFRDNLDQQIKVADIPGLVEGAHMNRGMGHKFLRHIERTKALIFVVDVGGFCLNIKEPTRSAFDCFKLLSVISSPFSIAHDAKFQSRYNCCGLLDELRLYKEGILQTRPAFLVINKMDTANAEENYREFINQYNLLPSTERNVVNHVHAMSLGSGEGIDQLKDLIRDLVT